MRARRCCSGNERDFAIYTARPLCSMHSMDVVCSIIKPAAIFRCTVDMVCWPNIVPSKLRQAGESIVSSVEAPPAATSAGAGAAGEGKASSAEGQKSFVEDILTLQAKLEAILKGAFFSQVRMLGAVGVVCGG